MDTPDSDVYVLVVDDESLTVRVIPALVNKRLRNSKAEGLLVKEATHPTVESVVSAIQERIAAALSEGYRPILIVDNSLGGQVKGTAVLDGLDPALPVIVSAGQDRAEMWDTYRAYVERGHVVGVHQKGTKPMYLLSLIDRHFNRSTDEVKVQDIRPEDSFQTETETVSALKTYAESLETESETRQQVLTTGKRIFEQALGFINHHLTSASGAEEETRQKAHAARGLLGALLAFVEQASEEGLDAEMKKQIQVALNFVISTFEGTKALGGVRGILEDFKTMHGLFGSQRRRVFPAIKVEGGIPDLDDGVDLEALRLILTNLLNNAYALLDIQVVKFWGRESETHHMIVVDDDGPPLPSGFFDVNLDVEAGSTGNGARHMLKIAKAKGWVLESGAGLGGKFVLRIPKAS